MGSIHHLQFFSCAKVKRNVPMWIAGFGKGLGLCSLCFLLFNIPAPVLDLFARL
jgi:hypothetical protein